MKKRKETVYLAGAISSDINYRNKFANAILKLKEWGFEKILTPTCLPTNLDYDQYFPICFGMIGVADIVVILNYSKGVQKELDYLQACKFDDIQVLGFTELQRQIEEEE